MVLLQNIEHYHKIINEIKKDRDERIDNIRTELDRTSKNYDELSKANAGLAV